MRWIAIAAALALAGCGVEGEAGFGGGHSDTIEGGIIPGSRLTQRSLRGEDGSLQPWGGWVDSHHGVECSPALASDGWMRCLPLGHQADLFADEDCTTMAVGIPWREGCHDDPPRFAHTWEPLTCGGSRYFVFVVGGELREAFRMVGDNCVPADMEGRVAFALLDEVPPSSFVRFEVE